ncbi:MAG TPA: hypothetical protein VMV18_07090 [bacterium]|nr:hypothetical protein [bacterium]
MSPRTAAAAFVLMFAAACASPDARPVVVVGFSSDPQATLSGLVMTSPDGTDFGAPVGVGEHEWLISVTPRGSGYQAIGLSGGLYDGDDGGAHWTRRPLHDSWLSALRYVEAAPSIGLASGADYWWKSTDGGQSWVGRRPPGYYFEDFSFSDPDHGVGVEAYLVPARGVAWRTTNGGATWSDSLEAARGLRVVARPDPTGPEIWAAGDDGMVVASTNGAASWFWVGTPIDYRFPDYTGIDFASPSEGYMVGSDGVVRAWKGDAPPPRDRWSYAHAGNYVLQGVFARGGGEAFACGYVTHTDTGVVLRTVDGGAHWAEVARTPHVFWYGIAGRRR